MARGMGEGWSDFYALALLAEPLDERLSTYTIGGYVSYLVTPEYTSNYYYGLRRFPVAVWRARGPNGRPYNPLSFRHLNANCNTEIGTTTSGPISAFPRGFIGATQCDQIHNAGEVWAVTLWEARDRLIERHGAVEGNRRILQYVTDGMKLSPLNPTFLQARDSIIIAANTADPSDVARLWAGFAIRGMGSGASVNSTSPASVTESFAFPPNTVRAPADFDGDNKTDISVYRAAQHQWWWQKSTDGSAVGAEFGIGTDVIAPVDFTGDGVTDLAFFNPASGTWFVLRSENSTYYSVPFGQNGDVPMPADYDGDGKSDVAVFRPSGPPFGTIGFILRSSDGQTTFVHFGLPLDRPVPADFDGDGMADVAMWRPSGGSGSGEWWILRSTAGLMALAFGSSTDQAVPGNYTGDNKADVAFFRPSTGQWFILRSEDYSYYAFPWGQSGDLPAPGDYDGDGTTDAAVFRNGVWYVNRSTSGTLITSFGLPPDQPVPGAFVR
jgi:hypothetical protein